LVSGSVDKLPDHLARSVAVPEAILKLPTSWAWAMVLVANARIAKKIRTRREIAFPKGVETNDNRTLASLN
jgi:hypothetical protein